jgi:hypothetical protein
MAGLGAINQVGESLVALLRARRDLLGAEGRLGPVPPAVEIAHVSLARLASAATPTAGLTLTPYRIALSEHQTPRAATSPATLALELHYLLAAWSPTGADEQALLGWAMLELAGHPVLDRSLLLGTGVWERDETVQVVLDRQSEDALFRVWDSLQQKLRLSITFRARVIRIGLEPGQGALPVVATRFGHADADPLVERGGG